MNNKFAHHPPAELKIDDNLINTVNKFSTKIRESLTKNLKVKDDYYTDSNFYRDNYKINSLTSRNNSTQITNIFKNDIIKPSLNSNQTSYLKNINDYDIKENYTRNGDRFLRYDLKKKSEFDIVKNTKVNLKPIEISLDKWPHFYER